MRIAVSSPTLVATFTKKNCILVIFGKFKKRNPRAVGFFRRILDQNVVVPPRNVDPALLHPCPLCQRKLLMVVVVVEMEEEEGGGFCDV